MCPPVPNATTEMLTVMGTISSPAIESAILDTPIFKIATTLTSLSQINFTQFFMDIVSQLNSGSIEFIQEDNMFQSIQMIACVVERQYFGFYADLRGSVCINGTSCTPGYLSSCPPFVLVCQCSAEQNAAASIRDFQQLSYTGPEVQLELSISLAFAPSFQPQTSADVSSAYLQLQQTLYNSLSVANSPTWAPFAIIPNAVLMTSNATPIVGITNTPTPGVYLSPAPTTVAAPSAGSSLSVGWALVAAFIIVAVQLCLERS
jgi:hypothetical protein